MLIDVWMHLSDFCTRYFKNMPWCVLERKFWD